MPKSSLKDYQKAMDEKRKRRHTRVIVRLWERWLKMLKRGGMINLSLKRTLGPGALEPVPETYPGISHFMPRMRLAKEATEIITIEFEAPIKVPRRKHG